MNEGRLMGGPEDGRTISLHGCDVSGVVPVFVRVDEGGHVHRWKQTPKFTEDGLRIFQYRKPDLFKALWENLREDILGQAIQGHQTFTHILMHMGVVAEQAKVHSEVPRCPECLNSIVCGEVLDSLHLRCPVCMEELHLSELVTREDTV